MLKLRFLAALMALAVIVPSCAKFHFEFADPTAVVDRVSASTVRISNSEGSCSGFVLERVHQVLTAAHCMGENLLADGFKTEVVKVDEYYDLALLNVPELSKAPLTLRDLPVSRGETLVAIGYAYGWNALTALQGPVLYPTYSMGDKNIPVGIVTVGGYIGGMSGGPVIDSGGKIVGIVQRTTTKLGYGVGSLFIRAFLLGMNPGTSSEPTHPSSTVETPMQITPYLNDHGA